MERQVLNKQHLYFLFYFILIIFLCSCTKNRSNQNREKHQVKDIQFKTVVIQPFHDVPPLIIDSLKSRLSKNIPSVELRENIALPQNAYYPERNRYRADSLNVFLWNRTTKNTIVLGVTNKDISVSKGKYKDWGIMGMAASIPAHSCIVSTFRLSAKNLNEQLYKITIHELGHAEGLYHCTFNETCIMRDYAGGNPIEELKSFCAMCTAHLKKKGWLLE